MQHFRYINTIRRPDGSLRPWREHDILERSESFYNESRMDHSSYKNEATRVKDRECDKSQFYWLRRSK